MISILIVEDDRNLLESLCSYLESEGYDTLTCTSLSQARERLRSSHYANPALMILDWMLSDGQGLDLLRELRHKSAVFPVILLTSRNELVDKIVGLETGANDYLTKPFEPRELLARIRVQLRTLTNSKTTTESALIAHFDIAINLDARTAHFQNKHIDLTKMEFDLLKLLMEHPGRVFPREVLLNKVWGYENYPTTRTVDNHIVQLRQKFGADLFETVRGIGYRFRALPKNL